MARLCMLIQEDLKYSRRLDLQNDTEPNITITVYLGRQKINIIGYYRQWQTLLNNNKVQGSGSINKQTTRFNKTVKFWTKSIKETETIMLCDSNINTQKLYSTENQKTSTERALKPIFSSLIDNILNQGVAIMPTGYTRQNHKGHLKTIDQIMTTHPQISTIQGPWTICTVITK